MGELTYRLFSKDDPNTRRRTARQATTRPRGQVSNLHMHVVVCAAVYNRQPTSNPRPVCEHHAMECICICYNIYKHEGCYFFSCKRYLYRPISNTVQSKFNSFRYGTTLPLVNSLYTTKQSDDRKSLFHWSTCRSLHEDISREP